MEILQGLLDNLTALLAAHPLAGEWYMAFVRFLFPALAVLILYRAVRSLLRIPHTPENWGQLSLPNGTSLPLTHWENILGRSKTADIYLNYPSISRQHAALCRGEDENWTLYDLGSKGGTAVNGEKVASSVPVKLGDTITLGGVPLIFLPQTVAEREEQEAKRRAERPAAIWPSFLWLTVFQVLACLQLLVAMGTEATAAVPMAFFGLTVVMWVYFAALRCTPLRGASSWRPSHFSPPRSRCRSQPPAHRGAFLSSFWQFCWAWCSSSYWDCFCGTWNGCRKSAGLWLREPSAFWASRWCWARRNMVR